MKRIAQVIAVWVVVICCEVPGWPQIATRVVSGTVVNQQGEAVQGADVHLQYPSGEQRVSTDLEGRFRMVAPAGAVRLRVSGAFIVLMEQELLPGVPSDGLELRIRYNIPPLHQQMVIVASALDPAIERRNEAVYSRSLFSRDDQVLHTLVAGINAGQHEGGGKSLEIRRFGFNLDHGGVGGGLKVLVEDIPQNQGTQGHGQGYLGSLKSLTPELVQDVDILNGPFSAEYGDFSGLGVVHVRLKEDLPNRLTLGLQRGSFASARSFIGYSPGRKKAKGFVAYEFSRTDGPFANPLRYQRHNVTSNYTQHLNSDSAIGWRTNFAVNKFFSSGQLPLDEVAAGRIDRFGFVDPFSGGKVKSGTVATYYRKSWATGDTLKVDGFVSRSLFDLYSNFTFFLNDPTRGDEIQQHDSRLQQGMNFQYLHPYRFFGQSSLLTLGTNIHDNQINVGLLRTVKRQPFETATSAHAHVTNLGWYAQQGVDLLHERLHINAGVRLDYFRFGVTHNLDGGPSGTEGTSRPQPKATVVYSPTPRIPVTLHASYGRGISSQDARGVVQKTGAQQLSTTDFLQLGSSHSLGRFSLSTDLFLIDRFNEQVYIPDDGSIEFKGPSRAYGWEAKTSVQVTRRLSFSGGLTQVSNAFYRGTFPRVYLDSAPHSVGNAGITLDGWRGFYLSLRYRYLSGYRLDGLDSRIRATGLDVLDVSLSKQLRHGVELTLAVDNLNNKRYFETQNYFESRQRPDAPVVARVHGTPGYPIDVTVGVKFRFSEK